MSQGPAIPQIGLTATQLDVSNVFVVLRDIMDQLNAIVGALSLAPDSTGRLRVALTGTDSITVGGISTTISANVLNMASIGGLSAALDQPYLGLLAESALRGLITVT